MPNIEKSHDTGLRIIEVLKILLNEDLDKSSIIKKLKLNDDIGNAYTLEAYIKYFNTFEELGLFIKKTENGCSLQNALFQIDITKEEEKLLSKIIQLIPKLNNKQQEDDVKKLITRIDKYVKPDLKKELRKLETRVFSDNMKMNIVNTLKKLMLEGAQITISYTRPNGVEVTLSNVTIKKIIENKGYYYILCYNPLMQRSRRICIDYITFMKQSPLQSPNIELSCTVIYEVYDRLAKSYKIKPWESVVNYRKGVLRISNTKEDYETLLPRLLKYGENCKIIRPSNVVDEFLELTNDVLHNLEETECLK